MNKDLMKIQALAIISGAMDVVTVGEEKPSLEKRLSGNDAKECAYSKCSKKHYHNNSCCSAKHFKLYMKEKKQK